MNIDLYQRLYEQGLISAETLEKAEQKHKNPFFSVHWELKTLLYLGVMLLSTGLGILIYKNIDTIGHQFILLFLALISAGSFAYCIQHKKPFSREKVESPNSFFDYILLLGCLTMVSFLGYIQFQFQIFGTHYGLATLIPTLILFYTAYQFDHIGILGMAVTSMALWMGISVSPKSFLDDSFSGSAITYTYLAFGLILLAAGYLSARYNFKKHFKFNYHHFGLNASFIALLAGFFGISGSNSSLIWAAGIFALATLLFFDALKDKSFYFLLLIITYSYIAFSTLVLSIIFKSEELGIFIYFILSAAGLIVLLKKLNTKIKKA